MAAVGHLQIILAACTLAAGVGAVAATVHIRRQYPLSFLKPLVGFLVSLTLVAALILTTHYLKTNVLPGNRNPTAWMHWVFRYNYPATTIFLGFINGAYVSLIRRLLGRRESRSASIAFGSAWTALFAVQMIAAAERNDTLILAAYAAADYVLTTLIIAGGTWVLFREARRASQGGKRSNLLGFARFPAAITLVWLAFRFAFFSGRLRDNAFYVVGQTAVILTSQLAVLFFLKRFVTACSEATASPVRTDEDRTALFEKFGITEREKEIIRFICDGLSNKEIQARLFISLQTVKDHVYRIYRKTGARNRVQLVNLFGGWSF